jgi:hypothetical protein
MAALSPVRRSVAGPRRSGETVLLGRLLWSVEFPLNSPPGDSKARLQPPMPRSRGAKGSLAMRTSSFLLIGSALLVTAGCGGNKGAGNNAAQTANNVAANTAEANTAAANTEAANAAAANTAAPEAANPEAAPAAPAAPAAAPASACPIVSSSDWLAEVHHHGKRVVVTGTVQVKSAGYRVALDEGDLDRGPPPLQHIKLKVKPPEGPAAQVITRRPVQIVVRNAGPGEKVAIDCKGEEIARVDVVRP